MADTTHLGSLVGIGEAHDLRSLTLHNIGYANDYDFLAELPRLERLELVDCWVTDFSAIRQLPDLREVTVLDCDNIDDITVLLDVPGLRRLKVNGLTGRLGPGTDTFLQHLRTRGVEVDTDDANGGPMWDDDLEEQFNEQDDDIELPDVTDDLD